VAPSNTISPEIEILMAENRYVKYRNYQKEDLRILKINNDTFL